MNFYNKIIKKFCRSLQYDESMKEDYQKLISYFVQDNDFEKSVEIINQWIILFLFRGDTIVVVNSSNRMMFKPSVNKQPIKPIWDVFLDDINKYLKISETMTGYRLYGKEYEFLPSNLYTEDVYRTVKHMVLSVDTKDDFTELVKFFVLNVVNNESDDLFVRKFVKDFCKDMKAEKIDQSIEKGILNYIRQNLFIDVLLHNAKKFKTNPNGFNTYIWYEMWEEIRKSDNYLKMYKEVVKYLSSKIY